MKTLLVVLAAAAIPAAAQQYRIQHAKVETRPAGASLEQTVNGIAAQSSAAWVAWAVPRVESRRGHCTVSLEDGNNVTRGEEGKELSGNVLVFLRVGLGNVEKVRAFGEECEIDGNGRTVYMLTGVRPADSVALLSKYATAPDGKLSDASVFAISQHAGGEADAALDRFVAPGQPEKLRERTVFWLGAARGKPGFERLRKLLKGDQSDHIRDKTVFAVYVSKVPESAQLLVDTAKADSSAHVRGQALFWLAQKASAKAAAAISEAVENDPDTGVKKKAVFALSQLPAGEGVPKLIEVARTNKNPAVRKNAMFWLGQSKDPRALGFFEEVLGTK